MNIVRQLAASIAGVLLFGLAVSPAIAQSASDLKSSPMPAPAAVPALPDPTPAPVPVVAQRPVLSAPYRISPGDELEIYVWGEERLQRSVRVLPDGTIAFPLIGQIVVHGMLLKELENYFSDSLRSQYRGQVPQVTISIRNPAGLQFAVMGKVRSPGSFSPGRYINILDAMSLAGGPAEFANLDNILIIRKSGDGVTSMRVRLGSLFKSGAAGNVDMSSIAKIQTGDTIIVP